MTDSKARRVLYALSRLGLRAYGEWVEFIDLPAVSGFALVKPDGYLEYKISDWAPLKRRRYAKILDELVCLRTDRDGPNWANSADNMPEFSSVEELEFRLAATGI